MYYNGSKPWNKSTKKHKKEHELIKFDEIDWANCSYTERQKAILKDEIPLNQVRLTELATLLKKAKAHGDEHLVEIVNSKRYKMKHKDDYSPPFSAEEATAILDSLDYEWVADLKKKIYSGERIDMKITTFIKSEDGEIRKKHYFCTPVMQFTVSGEYVQTFPSVTAAAQEIGCKPSTISNAAKHQRISFGWRWYIAPQDE